MTWGLNWVPWLLQSAQSGVHVVPWYSDTKLFWYLGTHTQWFSVVLSCSPIEESPRVLPRPLRRDLKPFMPRCEGTPTALLRARTDSWYHGAVVVTAAHSLGYYVWLA